MPRPNDPFCAGRVDFIRRELKPKFVQPCTSAGNTITVVSCRSLLAPICRTVPLNCEIRSVNVMTTLPTSLVVNSNGVSATSTPLSIADFSVQPLGDPPIRRKYFPGTKPCVVNLPSASIRPGGG